MSNPIIPLPGSRVAAEISPREIKLRIAEDPDNGPAPTARDTVQINSITRETTPTAALADPEEKEKKTKRKPIEVKSGSCVVKIYPSGGTDKRPLGPFTIAWREAAGGERKRAMRTTLEDAKKLAEQKAKLLANGQTQLLGFTPADHASYQRALQLLQPTGKQLELFVAECVEFYEKSGRAPFHEILQCWLSHRPGGITTKKIADIIPDLIQELKDNGVGERWVDTLESQLVIFAKDFNCPLHVVTGPQISSWLRNLKVKESKKDEKGLKQITMVPASLHTRKNYRGAIVQLVNFAKANGYLPKSWDAIDDVKAPRVRMKEIKILTPDQLVSLLSCARKSLIPFIALTAFAGIRHQEMNGKKALLDWSNIDLENRIIYVPPEVGKVGSDRNVPISDNLAAWLQPYAKKNGPVVKLKNTADPLLKAKTKAGIPAGKNETRNTLRKSFISYRLAIVKSRAQVAEESGNSENKIKTNYRKVVPEKEAKRWFNIWPKGSGSIIQLALEPKETKPTQKQEVDEFFEDTREGRI